MEKVRATGTSPAAYPTCCRTMGTASCVWPGSPGSPRAGRSRPRSWPRTTDPRRPARGDVSRPGRARLGPGGDRDVPECRRRPAGVRGRDAGGDGRPRSGISVASLVLKLKGNQVVTGGATRASRRGTTEVSGRWPVVNVWELDAEALLAAGDPGLIPWVPLARTDRSADDVLGDCRGSDRRGGRPARPIGAGRGDGDPGRVGVPGAEHTQPVRRCRGDDSITCARRGHGYRPQARTHGGRPGKPDRVPGRSVRTLARRNSRRCYRRERLGAAQRPRSSSCDVPEHGSVCGVDRLGIPVSSAPFALDRANPNGRSFSRAVILTVGLTGGEQARPSSNLFTRTE